MLDGGVLRRRPATKALYSSRGGRCRPGGLGLTLSSILAVMMLVFFYLWQSIEELDVGDSDRAEEQEAPTYQTLSVYSVCERLVLQWAAQEQEKVQKEQHNVRVEGDMLWFLHIPRTGGRCFHSCFLKSGFEMRDRCYPSYDYLRADEMKTCRVLGSHDDFSISSLLAKENRHFRIVQMQRDPVDRILSAYEFAVQNAAGMAYKHILELAKKGKNGGDSKGLAPFNEHTVVDASMGVDDEALLTSHRQRPGRGLKTSGSYSMVDPRTRQRVDHRRLPRSRQLGPQNSMRAKGSLQGRGQSGSGESDKEQRAKKLSTPISTNLVWPWKYLLPWLANDMVYRFHHFSLSYNLGNQTNQTDPKYDPYNNPYYMPLKEFVAHPIVFDLLHNGAALQNTGMTNNSYYRQATAIRNCVQQSGIAAAHLLSVALRRMESFDFVGLTKDHKGSAEVALSKLGWGEKYPYFGNREINGTSLTNSTLANEYSVCAYRSYYKQNKRRDVPMRGMPIILNPAGRKGISKNVYDFIRNANALDTVLFERGQAIFEEHKTQFAGKVHMPEVNKTAVRQMDEDAARRAQAELRNRDWRGDLTKFYESAKAISEEMHQKNPALPKFIGFARPMMFRACGQIPMICTKLGLLAQRQIFKNRFTELDTNFDDRLSLDELLAGFPQEHEETAKGPAADDKERKQTELGEQLLKGEVVEDVIDGVDQSAINVTVKSVHTFTAQKYEDFVSGNVTNDGSQMSVKEAKRSQRGHDDVSLRAEAAIPLIDPERDQQVPKSDSDEESSVGHNGSG